MKRQPLSPAARSAVRALLKDPGVGAEIRAYLATPPGTVFDPHSPEMQTLENTALRGSFDAGYRRVLSDLDEAINAQPTNIPKPIHPQSV